MFGISFTELLLIALVVLLVVGPRRLPGMLRQIGEWVSKLRRMTSEVREQTGIDDVLRDEGLPGGLSELRRMVRGDFGAMDKPVVVNSPYETVDIDHSREYPAEGPDAYGALPDDLVPPAPPQAVAADADAAGEEKPEEPPQDDSDNGPQDDSDSEPKDKPQEGAPSAQPTQPAPAAQRPSPPRPAPPRPAPPRRAKRAGPPGQISGADAKAGDKPPASPASAAASPSPAATAPDESPTGAES